MGIVVSSNLPGYKLLHDRICAALDRCQELPDVDFKQSCSWEDLQWTIIKAVLAMGNLRDGGIVIIGVAERDDTWQLEGIADGHFETFDTDDFYDKIEPYISPPVRPTLLSVEYSINQPPPARKFLAIVIEEFAETPLVCKKTVSDPADRRKSILKAGSVYIRPLGGRPQTRKVETAEDMSDLLELAAEKRARRLLEVSRRVGLVPVPSVTEHFEAEIQDVESQLNIPPLESPHWRITFRPEFYQPEKISSLSECSGLVEQSRVRWGGGNYPCQIYDARQGLFGAHWVGAWSNLIGYDYWRFYQSSQFFNLFSVRDERNERLERWADSLSSYPVASPNPIEGFVSYRNLIYKTTQIFEFAARLCARDVYDGALTIAIELRNVENYVLVHPESSILPDNFCRATQNTLPYSPQPLSIDNLIADSRGHAIRAVAWFVQRFGDFETPISSLERIQRDIDRGY